MHGEASRSVRGRIDGSTAPRIPSDAPAALWHAYRTVDLANGIGHAMGQTRALTALGAILRERGNLANSRALNPRCACTAGSPRTCIALATMPAYWAGWGGQDLHGQCPYSLVEPMKHHGYTADVTQHHYRARMSGGPTVVADAEHSGSAHQAPSTAGNDDRSRPPPDVSAMERHRPGSATPRKATRHIAKIKCAVNRSIAFHNVIKADSKRPNRLLRLHGAWTGRHSQSQHPPVSGHQAIPGRPNGGATPRVRRGASVSARRSAEGGF